MNSAVFNSVCVYYIVIVDCCQLFFKYFLVRVARFELARPKTGDFKSPAATCYAILALIGAGCWNRTNFNGSSDRRYDHIS